MSLRLSLADISQNLPWQEKEEKEENAEDGLEKLIPIAAEGSKEEETKRNKEVRQCADASQHRCGERMMPMCDILGVLSCSQCPVHDGGARHYLHAHHVRAVGRGSIIAEKGPAHLAPHLDMPHPMHRVLASMCMQPYNTCHMPCSILHTVSHYLITAFTCHNRSCPTAGLESVPIRGDDSNAK